MREILFKGKDIYTNEWVEGSLVIFPNTGRTKILKWNNSDLDFDQIEVIPESVRQYTGLTDKNGKKIFESDIVKLYLIDGIEIGVIKFNDIMCRFMFFTKDDSYSFDNTCKFEIIGNIYDNPKLLNN